MNAKTASLLIKPDTMSNPALLLKALIEAGFPAESFIWLSYVHNMKTLWDSGVVNMDSLNDKAESWDSYYAGWLNAPHVRVKYLGESHSDDEIKESFAQRAKERADSKLATRRETAGVTSTTLESLEVSPALRFGRLTPAEYLNANYALAGKWTPALLEGFTAQTQSQGLKLCEARAENMNAGKRLPQKQRAALRAAFNGEWKERGVWLSKPSDYTPMGKPSKAESSAQNARLDKLESTMTSIESALVVLLQNASTPAQKTPATPRKPRAKVQPMPEESKA